MREELLRHLEETGLIPPGFRVLVAYSGGPDSTCLLHLLHSLEIDVAAGYLHHSQRPDADKELERCQAFCSSLDIAFLNGRADVPALADSMGIGLEEAGRIARYEFLARAAKALECNLIATGHTRSDTVETVLFNLARGTGLSGASGIPAKRGNVVRPLLIFDRSETHRYCEDLGIWTSSDSGNENIEFSRVRIRNRVLPELIAINPAAVANIARFAGIAGEEDRFLDSAAAAALERAEIRLNGEHWFLTKDCEVAFRAEELRHLPPVLSRRALILAFSALGAPLDFAQASLALETLRGGCAGSVTAEGGNAAAEFSRERVMVRIVRPTAPFRFPLTVPGETESEEFGWRFAAWIARAAPSTERASFEIAIDTSKLNGPPYLRTAEQGDEMEPLGFPHRRKVSDILSEAKLTLAARQRMPIICDMVGPIWIPGVCVSNRVKLEGDSDRALHIRFGPIEGAESDSTETTHPK